MGEIMNKQSTIISFVIAILLFAPLISFSDPGEGHGGDSLENNLTQALKDLRQQLEAIAPKRFNLFRSTSSAKELYLNKYPNLLVSIDALLASLELAFSKRRVKVVQHDTVVTIKGEPISREMRTVVRKGLGAVVEVNAARCSNLQVKRLAWLLLHELFHVAGVGSDQEKDIWEVVRVIKSKWIPTLQAYEFLERPHDNESYKDALTGFINGFSYLIKHETEFDEFRRQFDESKRWLVVHANLQQQDYGFLFVNYVRMQVYRAHREVNAGSDMTQQKKKLLKKLVRLNDIIRNPRGRLYSIENFSDIYDAKFSLEFKSQIATQIKALETYTVSSLAFIDRSVVENLERIKATEHYQTCTYQWSVFDTFSDYPSEQEIYRACQKVQDAIKPAVFAAVNRAEVKRQLIEEKNIAFYDWYAVHAEQDELSVQTEFLGVIYEYITQSYDRYLFRMRAVYLDVLFNMSSNMPQPGINFVQMDLDSNIELYRDQYLVELDAQQEKMRQDIVDVLSLVQDL
jgi:hypothetical protein